MPASIRVAAAGLAALAVAMGIGRFAFTPLLPMMQDDAGVSLAQGGYLAAANYLGYLAGALWAMRPARRDRAIRGALLAIALVTLAMGTAHGMLAWTLLRALAGMASAWALVHVSSWCLEELAALGRPQLGGVVFSGVGWGIALAGALCLALMALSASSSQAWVALGALSLVATAVLWPMVKRGAEPAARATNAFAWTPDAVRLVFCYGVFGFGYIIPATFVPVMAKDIIADPAVFGWAWPLFGTTAALSTIFAARLGNRRGWIIAALAMALGVAAPIFMTGVAGILAAALLVGGSFMVITMAGMQEARQVGGAALMAAMTAAFAVGQIAGPLVVSTFAHRPGGMSAALAIAAVLLVVSAVALGRKEQPCPT
ncbi:MAG TPA: YbfB/YjiJ family MFS transporter [Stellaceae bacterium]